MLRHIITLTGWPVCRERSAGLNEHCTDNRLLTQKENKIVEIKRKVAERQRELDEAREEPAGARREPSHRTAE
ncbi:DUF1090 family protein [Salmonella enterica]|nr:DUF1090 family protein [Salmonella enterica]